MPLLLHDLATLGDRFTRWMAIAMPVKLSAFLALDCQSCPRRNPIKWLMIPLPTIIMVDGLRGLGARPIRPSEPRLSVLEVPG